MHFSGDLSISPGISRFIWKFINSGKTALGHFLKIILELQKINANNGCILFMYIAKHMATQMLCLFGTP